MSSSRSGSNSRRQRSRDPHQDYASLPPPRLPSLRSLAAQRERELSPSSTSTGGRSQTRHWTAAASRRAERIRSLDPDQSTLDEFHRVLDQAWGNSPSFGHFERSRSSDSRQSNLADLDRSLDEANSHLRALLEMTNHSGLSATLAPPSSSPPPHRPNDLIESSRRNKRRKIETENQVSAATPLRYGKYGQVEPGQLRMEIVSCDGGMFSNESSYAAENILKNDSSVYCTKGNRCNIVLRHQGATPFTLQELVIKGPTSMNYSHPVREGMVFVAMQLDDVLNHTTKYQIQYAPTSRAPSWYGQREDNREPRHTISIRHHEDGSTTRTVRRAPNFRHDEDDYRIAQMPPEFSTDQFQVGVSTECSDEDEGDADARRYRRPPNRIGALPFESMESGDDDEFNSAGIDFEDFTVGWGPPSQQEQASLSLSEAWEAHAQATQEAVRAVGGEMLTPHARFLIEKRKSTCTIRFDPPVSGRYILLKMWNSHHDTNSNIDIQSVIARGFAGPRYFPSVQLR